MPYYTHTSMKLENKVSKLKGKYHKTCLILQMRNYRLQMMLGKGLSLDGITNDYILILKIQVHMEV